jgi:hypothetical protein
MVNQEHGEVDPMRVPPPALANSGRMLFTVLVCVCVNTFVNLVNSNFVT